MDEVKLLLCIMTLGRNYGVGLTRPGRRIRAPEGGRRRPMIRLQVSPEAFTQAYPLSCPIRITSLFPEKLCLCSEEFLLSVDETNCSHF